MRRFVLLLAVAGSVACGDREVEEQPTAQPSAAAPAATPQGQEGFALLRGDDTLAIERYSRTGNSLEGEVRDVPDGGRLTYRATIGSEERITRMELAFYPAGATEPRQRATAEFRGDTLIGTKWEDGEEEVERLPTPPGTMLHVGNSIATLEQVVRRARALGGTQVELPMLLIGRDEDEHELIERARVNRIAADSVHLVLDEENQARASVDEQGRIQGAVNPSSNIRIVRLR